MAYDKVTSVSIEVGTSIYSRLKDMKNSPAHVFAEFIDNAYQSYLDHKQDLHATACDYKLRVSIDFRWGNMPGDGNVVIRDNAAGIDYKHFLKAFILAHTPDKSDGLNEFGMGLKTAALWVGHEWELTSSALNEPVKRSVSFNLNDVLEHRKTELPVKELTADPSEHFTEIIIRSFTDNTPSAKKLEPLKKDLASIYRQRIRLGEMELIVNGQLLTFQDIPVLEAPFYKNRAGDVMRWRKDIDINFMGGKYKAKGFIAIMRDIKNGNNGLVLIRRGRAILGAEESQRYLPKKIFGNVGSFAYKRLFGEIEVEGFKVTFNKNNLVETDDLEALMASIRYEIHTKTFDLLAQAENYRVNENYKKAQATKKAQETAQTKNPSPPVSVNTQTNAYRQYSDAHAEPSVSNGNIVQEPPEQASWEDYFKIDGEDYTLKMVLVDGGQDLIWINTKQEKNHVVECRLNTAHPFCETFFKKKSFDQSCMAVFRAMAMAKFTSQQKTGSVAEMFDFFNEYILQIKT